MTPSTPPRRDPGPPQITRYPDVHCAKSRSRRANAGFTLIEILVVISIIALLIGLITVGAVVAQSKMQNNRTRAMMQALMGAVEEYKVTNGTPPPHNVAVPGGLTSSEAFVWSCESDDTLRELLLASMQGRGVFKDVDGDGYEELYDPWDNQIVYRAVNDGSNTVGPGGVNNDGLPIHAFPFFVSAGPDGQFGRRNGTPEELEEMKDNITSIEIGS